MSRCEFCLWPELCFYAAQIPSLISNRVNGSTVRTALPATVSRAGDGVGARSLPVRPADHTNAAVMNSRSDAFLRDVIAKGGKAMGLSAFMPAWQGIFKDKEIEDLLAYIRSLPAAK